ncbi:PhzF family phenazine biosynthesis protein [Pseudomonas vanderleydeniana]|uniref:PhzF family phenazine biosynthesis protein n=1 Tax=Pseudomonas vanderleydeniana TaxID=2745495 RepID=A0A9E6PG79_9PSED|nr:PhzF family phenazine biosynthesis protein [Pseudomonas vanderleydeniana]QXI25971.1 PhzF family phenazine biosynthesis protein [Pseudomonas vanderleydeniana]
MRDVQVVEVFKSASGGGNPAPIAVDAEGLTAEQMTAIARRYGHESGFAFHPEQAADNDYRFRFFVPLHEMSMCGHATIGTVWLLHKLGRLQRERLSIETLSGTVTAHVQGLESQDPFIEISQPVGTVEPLSRPELREEIIEAIGLRAEDILDLPLLNAATSRVKTLIPVRNPALLDAARPDSARIEALCELIDSTGFYLFCPRPGIERQFDSRQFPKASGYPEDAATGIAATALAFGLLQYGLIENGERSILVHQGRAMGRPSDIHVRFELDGQGQPNGCFVGGYSAFATWQQPEADHHGA